MDSSVKNTSPNSVAVSGPVCQFLVGDELAGIELGDLGLKDLVCRWRAEVVAWRPGSIRHRSPVRGASLVLLGRGGLVWGGDKGAGG